MGPGVKVQVLVASNELQVGKSAEQHPRSVRGCLGMSGLETTSVVAGKISNALGVL